MSYLNALLSDLRNRRVWPIAAVLLLALVAVPVLLHRSPSPASAPAPTAALPITTATGVPTVTAATAREQAAVTGSSRDPFSQPHVAAATSATATSAPLASAASAAAAAVSAATRTVAASARGATSAAATSVPATSGSSGAASSASSAYTGTGIVTPPAAPGGQTASSAKPLTPSTPRPAASGLAADEHYDVSVAVTDPSGGFTTVDPFERLGAIPGDGEPWLVQLGVLAGGGHVVFAVAPNATVSGPAACVPGGLDCEIISLAPGQDETVSGPGASPVTFQITGVSAVTDGSASAAAKARTTADATGAALLSRWQRAAFALFPYVPSRGVVADERNLIVGGN